MPSLLQIGAADHWKFLRAATGQRRQFLLRRAAAAIRAITYVTPLILWDLPRLSGFRHLDPPRVGRGIGVFVAPLPPVVRRSLRVPLRGILPCFLAAEGSRIEVAPGRPHRLVPARIDEIGAEYFVAVAEKHVRTVPLVHAEVGVESVL